MLYQTYFRLPDKIEPSNPLSVDHRILPSPEWIPAVESWHFHSLQLRVRHTLVTPSLLSPLSSLYTHPEEMFILRDPWLQITPAIRMRGPVTLCPRPENLTTPGIGGVNSPEGLEVCRDRKYPEPR